MHWWAVEVEKSLERAGAVDCAKVVQEISNKSFQVFTSFHSCRCLSVPMSICSYDVTQYRTVSAESPCGCRNP